MQYAPTKGRRTAGAQRAEHGNGREPFIYTDAVKNLTDREYLLEQQYCDPSNLDARVALHRRFRSNPEGSVARWFGRQLDLPENARVLEVGCGAGGFWPEIDDMIPHSWQLTLSDFSPGMVAEAGKRLQGLNRPVTVLQADVHDLPLADASFDGVIANFMLYHATDRPKAIAEIHRVLKPGGKLYAMTNGSNHMREFHELVNRVVPGTARDEESGFSLENGPSQLEGLFKEIEVRRCPGSLVVNEVEPILAYVRSWITWLTPGQEAALRLALEEQIAASGAVRIMTEPGLITGVTDEQVVMLGSRERP